MQNPLKRSDKQIQAIFDSIDYDNYEILNIFESGSFSGVAVVKNRKLAGRPEDIKFLESVEPFQTKSFIQQGKILSAIHHPNIPAIYDILESEDVLLFRQEHIEGYSLREMIEALNTRNKRLPKNIATLIILDLMKALHYTHNDVRYNGKKVQIIHCDIKPSNIILFIKGLKRKKCIDDEFLDHIIQGKGKPYLIDFGISMFQGQTSQGINGTVNYMSKAQVSENKIDWRTDIYQLFLVYHEMLTGIKPFSGVSRKKIHEQKLQNDFVVNSREVSKPAKELIERATSNNTYFKCEKEILSELTRLHRKEKQAAFLARHRNKIVSVFSIIFLFMIAGSGYYAYDYYFLSTEAILNKIERNPKPSMAELKTALNDLQKRNFEKKYLNPLLEGEFRDKDTGNLLYPSHLNADGNWVFKGPESEAAGGFTGMLFEQSERYPELHEYAVEYSKPILKEKYDGSNNLRFIYALIPAYEKTHKKVYLKKLIKVADSMNSDLERISGMTQITHIYNFRLFLWLYETTGDPEYLELTEKYIEQFIDMNIEDDGYVFELSMVNMTLPNGVTMPDDKHSRLVVPYLDDQTGIHLSYKLMGLTEFKDKTSVFARDYQELLCVLVDLYELTGKEIYMDKIKLVEEYYNDRYSVDFADRFFVSYHNSDYNIPKDNLVSVKSLQFYKRYDKRKYKSRLKQLLSTENFRKETENGILSGSVLIEELYYDNDDVSIRNQTLILADKLFMEI